MKGSFWLVAIIATILAVADLEAAQQSIVVPTECPADDPFDTTVLLAHESDCSKFYVCFLGEKILKDCPYENSKGDRLHFNPLKQVCEYPVDAGCLSKPIAIKELTTPAAAQLTNKANSQLTPLVSLLTTPHNLPSSLINSSNIIKYRSHQCDCSLYYKYINGNEILKQCENDFHWNQELQHCYTPAEAECNKKGNSWALIRLPLDVSCIDGEYYIHECQCDLYYLCVSGDRVLKTCPVSSGIQLHWSQDKKQCTLPEEANCPHIRKCIENSYKPHESDCNAYYKCSNNDWDLRHCPSGLHWSKDRNICTTPRDAKCIKFCDEDSYKPHESDCNAYYKCRNNGWDLRHCPSGLHWSKDRNICTTPKDAKCERICVENSYKPHESDCNAYYKCSDNDWDLRHCPSELHWSKDRNICTTPRDAKCIKFCDEDSYKPHESDCNAYYKCRNNGWDLRHCPSGLHWSKDRNICTTPKDAKCERICVENSYKPHESDCNAYYKCSDNDWDLRHCPSELHWSKDRNICTTPRDAKCIKFCEEDSYKPHESDCNAYYMCRNNGWDLRHCPSGLHWSKDRNICTTPRDAKCERICVENSYKPHESDCNAYYKCSDNDWDLRHCPSGLHWSKDHNICTTPKEAKCERICVENSYKPHESDCNAYYKCSDNDWDLRHCPSGLHWSKDRNICTTPRDAKCERICVENSYKPHESDCNAYYKCSDNDWDLRHCPSGLHWSKDRNICTTPRDAKCERICVENSYKPHESDCNAYYKCSDNDWDLRHCPSGLHWSKDRNICTTPKDAKCERICVENSYKPHESDCNAYYKCSDNDWDLRRCPSGLHWSKEHSICTSPEEAKCEEIHDCDEGSYMRHECKCEIYYQCIDYRYVRKVCKNGLHWDQTHFNCTTPEEANCPYRKICDEGSTRPHDCKCNLYYKCINNQLILKECSSGLHWDRINNKCTTPDEAKCPNYHKFCDEGSTRPHKCKCNLYYKCTNNQLVLKECTNGLHWDRNNNYCTTPNRANCPNYIPKVCDEGSYSPHECQCNAYYKCINNQLVLLYCPSGRYWNREANICISKENSDCQPKTTKACRERLSGAKP